MHGAALCKRGAGHGHTGLLDAASGQGHVTLECAQQTGIAHAASRAASDEARRVFIAAGGGTGVGGRTHARRITKTVPCRELHLALARFDLASIVHAVPGQQHVAPPRVALVGSWVAMRAPRSTITLPNASLSALLLASGLYRPVVAELRIADPCCSRQQIA